MLSNYVSVEDFNKAVCDFRSDDSLENGKQLADAFKKVAINIQRFGGIDFAVDECVYAAFKAVDRFNPDQPAFNYFITVMLNHMRKEYRKNKEREKIKSYLA